MNIFHDFEGIDKPIATTKKNWESFCDEINTGFFHPNEIDLALNHIFLKTFDNLFSALKDVANLTKELRLVGSENEIIRGAVIRPDEYDKPITQSRILPQKEFIKEDNRFSPKGIEWLYLAISDELPHAIECCMKECRAKKNDKFAFSSFEISHNYYDSKVVDLTVGVEYDYSELENSLEHFAQENYKKAEKFALDNIPNKAKKMRKSKLINYIKQFRENEKFDSFFTEYRRNLEKFVILTHSKIISENIFESVENNKSEKYTPFHCLAQYFISKGYVGIIYSSTVCKNGKNLVLFGKKYASPVGEISELNV